MSPHSSSPGNACPPSSAKVANQIQACDSDAKSQHVHCPMRTLAWIEAYENRANSVVHGIEDAPRPYSGQWQAGGMIEADSHDVRLRLILMIPLLLIVTILVRLLFL